IALKARYEWVRAKPVWLGLDQGSWHVAPRRRLAENDPHNGKRDGWPLKLRRQGLGGRVTVMLTGNMASSVGIGWFTSWAHRSRLPRPAWPDSSSCLGPLVPTF